MINVDSKFAPSQWETVLHCNDVSYWLGGNLESTLMRTLITDYIHVKYGRAVITHPYINWTAFGVEAWNNSDILENNDVIACPNLTLAKETKQLSQFGSIEHDAMNFNASFLKIPVWQNNAQKLNSRISQITLQGDQLTYFTTMYTYLFIYIYYTYILACIPPPLHRNIEHSTLKICEKIFQIYPWRDKFT